MKSYPRFRLQIVWLGSRATIFVLLLMLALGVAGAENLFYEAQQQEQQPPSDGILCPDQNSRCPNTATCCQMSSGKWGCCPFARATCCNDNVHCCPNGYTCNNGKEQCVRAISNDTIPWAKKEEAAAVSASSSSEETISPNNSLTCADRKSTCPGIASCCRTLTGAYRCCSYPNDVCCSDGHSCCPLGTICDLLNRKCISGFETEKWGTVSASTPASRPSEKTPAAVKLPANVVATSGEEKTTPSPIKIVPCDSHTYCQDGQTCCFVPGIPWVCCPYPLAVCCTGSYFCCPHGKRCSNPPGYCY